MHRFLCTLTRGLSACVVTLAAAVAVAQEPAPTLAVEALERGQTGYGLSVFEGSVPVRFDVEVLGVVRNSSPGSSFVLARLTGQGLEQTGVIAGMSGSPVFIDDRLIGAVAFAWPFTNGAVGGITPIGQMRRLSGMEAGPPAGGAVHRTTSLAELQRRRFPEDLLPRALERMTPASAAPGRPGLLWSLSGFGEASRGLIERALTGVAPAGETTADIAPLEAGSAVAGVLVDGDLKLAVTGTVTDRTGDEVLAFGHPFLGQGPIRLPMATSEVVTVLSNQAISFKIANMGEVIGSFDLDVAAGVRGRVGAFVDTIPLSISLSGMGSRVFRMQLADVRVYLPTLVAVAGLGAFDSVSRSGGAQGVDMRVRWDLEPHGPVELRQSFDGPGAGFSAATYLLVFTSYLANNPLEETRLTNVEIEIEQHPVPRTVRVLGGFANRAVVEPGEQVEVTLELKPHRGEIFQMKRSLAVPRDLPSGRYSLIVGDGVTVDAVRAAVEPVEPLTFGQSLDRIREFRSSRDLVTIGLVPAAGLTFSGAVLPQLPGSLRQLWGPLPGRGAKPLGLATVQEIVAPLEWPLEGGVRIDLEIRRPASTSMRPPTGAAAGRWVDSGLAPGALLDAVPALEADRIPNLPGNEEPQ